MDKILILDFGSQVSQLIARRVRELHVYCEMHLFHWDIEKIIAFNPKGIILSGGPESVYKSTYQADPAILNLGIPILGICYGMHWMVQTLGGEVIATEQREFGYAKVMIQNSPLTEGLSDYSIEQALDVWMSHGDKVSMLPSEYIGIGSTQNCTYAIIGNLNKNFYGVQFHPEVTHTKLGVQILQKFIYKICAAKSEWTMSNFIDKAIDQIRQQVGNDEVILALSGGVDSSVAATLIHHAIGEQLTCVFVDHGLLRLHESGKVMDMLSSHLGVPIIHKKVVSIFMQQLQGITDPEQKRKIIGAEFIKVFEAEAKKNPRVKWLAQGTIYPDVIESAGHSMGATQTIKNHHNVGGLPETLNLLLLEPLRYLFKDEVRALGKALGLPETMVYRHPFPGPGLAVRILGEVKQEYVDLLRLADHIFIDELQNTQDEAGVSWYDRTSQALVVFMPVKSVGVMGDTRTYEYVVALRAVVTNDFMTATWAELPYSLLAKISNRIINEIRGINRVVYDISSKPPATIEWE